MKHHGLGQNVSLPEQPQAVDFFPAFGERSFVGVITPPEQELCSPKKTNEPSASELHSWKILLWLKSKHILDHLMMEVVGLSK